MPEVVEPPTDGACERRPSSMGDVKGSIPFGGTIRAAPRCPPPVRPHFGYSPTLTAHTMSPGTCQPAGSGSAATSQVWPKLFAGHLGRLVEGGRRDLGLARRAGTQHPQPQLGGVQAAPQV